MKLIPLEQWICDYCGKIINSADEGWLEWLKDGDRLNYDFKIVHQNAASPNQSENGCYFHRGKVELHDVSLKDHVGEDLVAFMMSFLDVGPYHDRKYSGHRVKDMREFVEIFRRLGLIYYEEARNYFGEAEASGMFDGANEIFIYKPDTLKSIITKFVK